MRKVAEQKNLNEIFLIADKKYARHLVKTMRSAKADKIFNKGRNYGSKLILKGMQILW